MLTNKKLVFYVTTKHGDLFVPRANNKIGGILCCVLNNKHILVVDHKGFKYHLQPMAKFLVEYWNKIDV